MLYEIRIYRVQVGRGADIERRMLAEVPALFAEHGLRAVGHWTALAGPDLPAFLYLLEWRDAAEREARWASFYADPRWWDLRQRSNAGSELVEHYDLWLMKPQSAWLPPFDAITSVEGPALHEMLIHKVAIGQGAALNAHLRAAVLPTIAACGGRTLAVLEMIAGPHVPSMAIFIAWADFSARSEGRRRLESQGGGTPTGRAALLGRSDVYLLRPLATPAVVTAAATADER